MQDPLAPSVSVIERVSKRFIDKDGNDLFVEFLDTLIMPSEPAGLTADLVQTVWTTITRTEEALEEKQRLIAEAFMASEGPNDLAAAWRTLLEA